MRWAPRTQGTLDATLGARPNITAKLRVPGTFDVDQLLGVSAHAPGRRRHRRRAGRRRTLPSRRPGAGKPIDLSGLKAFDATISLETSATTIASLPVAYADLEATLRNGVLTISKLTGQFYGGAVDFTGTIDASGQTVVVDMTGSLQGIYVGEMLRGTAGTNNFNDPNLTLSIDGKLSATGIQLKGAGQSRGGDPQQPDGTAGLSGFVYPAVTQGSLDFARFATGVGSIFSANMAFISAMLRGFVNRQNPIAGPDVDRRRRGDLAQSDGDWRQHDGDHRQQHQPRGGDDQHRRQHQHRQRPDAVGFRDQREGPARRADRDDGPGPSDSIAAPPAIDA